MENSSFFFSSKINNFLVYGVNINSNFGFISLMIGIACLSCLLEGSRVLHLHLINARKSSCNRSVTFRKKFVALTVEGAVYVLALPIDYSIMLAIMTYNAWFLIFGVIGNAIGYWFFGILKFNLELVGECSRHNSLCDKSKLTGAEELLHNEPTDPIINNDTEDMFCHPIRSVSSDITYEGQTISNQCSSNEGSSEHLQSQLLCGNQILVEVDVHGSNVL